LPPLSVSAEKIWRAMALGPTIASVGSEQGDGFVFGLLADDDLDELRLGLDHAAGMPVAQLFGNKLFQLGLVGGEHRLPEIFDGLVDGGVIGALPDGS
jgi:hypothetical protein